ncbi:MAG: hypothetical protein M1819_001091 [Sarea resinae]|nr:MAG: hypothetical protein M1819_001091 [Sarea resinae]
MAAALMFPRTYSKPANAVALDALMYRYSAPGSVPSQGAASTMWWDNERIEATVTRDYVASKLRSDERELLDKALAFGDGLTDDTYIEWILTRAKRLFLILLDIGVPDQIFGVVDDSWDDADLPIALEDVERLKLSYDGNEALDRKFHKRQYAYLLRYLKQGQHITYGPDEIVPAEPVHKRLASVIYHGSEKVCISGCGNKSFLRRRIDFDESNGEHPEQRFVADLEALKAIEHDHITPIWGSYTFAGSGYLLMDFTTEVTLKSFLQTQTQQFKNLSKTDRRQLLLNWLHCLSSSLKFLHRKGYCHGDLRPSNIMVDSTNNIVLGGITALSSLQTDKKPNETESYEYGAPEKWLRVTAEFDALPIKQVSARSHVRKISGGSPTSSPTKHDSFGDFGGLSDSLPSPFSYSSKTASYHSSSSLTAKVTTWHNQTVAPQKSDVFSLGCVFLDILSCLLKRKASSFSSHRSAKNESAGRGGAPADSSFHANLGQIDTWIDNLERDALKKDDVLMSGVPHILRLVRWMISRSPDQRPTARQVQESLYDILMNQCQILRPHCQDCTGCNHDSGLGSESGRESMYSSATGSTRWSKSSGSTESTMQMRRFVR